MRRPERNAVTARGSSLIDPTDALREALRGHVRLEWGQWLMKFLWHHFATLTFANSPSIEGAVRQFGRWVRHLEQRTQQAIHWFYALERGAAGLLHFHVLTRGTDGIDSRAIGQAWPCGRSDVSAYDPKRGATYYVTKFVGADHVEYDLAFPVPRAATTLRAQPSGLRLRRSET